MKASRQRGFAMIELVVGIALMVAATAALASILHASVANSAARTRQQHASIDLADFVNGVEADADDAVAIFVPTRDVNGNANSDGHEVDFFTRDASKTPHFWAYLYTAPSPTAPAKEGGTIQKYIYSTPGGAATAQGNPQTGFLGLAATSIEASSVSSPMFASGAKPASHDVPTGFAGVVAGNKATQITVSAVAGTAGGKETRTLLLMAGLLPNGLQAVIGTFTPPPPASGSLSVSPASLTFANPSAAAQGFSARDDRAYIGQFSQTNTCGSALTLSPSVATAVPESSWGSLPYMVTPNTGLTTATNCEITIADQLGNTAQVAVSVLVPPLTASPNSLSAYSAGSALYTIFSQTGYTGPVSVLSNPCGSAVSLSPSPVSIGGQLTITGVSPAQCTITFQGAWGQTAQVAVDVMGRLTATPASLVFPYPHAPSQLVAITKAGGPVMSLGTKTTSCGNTISYVANGPGSSTATVGSPSVAGSCSFVPDFQHGFTDETTTVNVTTYGALTCGSGCALTFTSSTSPAQSVLLSKSGFPSVLTLSAGAPSCGSGVFTINWAPDGSGQALVTVAPTSATTNCKVVLADAYGETATLTIVIGSAPTPPPAGPCSGNNGNDLNYLMDWAYGETLDGHAVTDQGSGSGGAGGGGYAIPQNAHASGSGPWTISASNMITIQSLGGMGLQYNTTNNGTAQETTWSADFEYVVSDSAGGGSCTMEAEGAGRYDGDYDGGGYGSAEGVDWSD